MILVIAKEKKKKKKVEIAIIGALKSSKVASESVLNENKVCGYILSAGWAGIPWQGNTKYKQNCSTAVRRPACCLLQ